MVPFVRSEDGEHMLGGQNILEDAWLPNVVDSPMRVTEMYMGCEDCLGEDV